MVTCDDATWGWGSRLGGRRCLRLGHVRRLYGSSAPHLEWRGDPDDSLRIAFGRGTSVLLGENDSGKTAIIDAIRLFLQAAAADFYRITRDDFHVGPLGVLGRPKASPSAVGRAPEPKATSARPPTTTRDPHAPGRQRDPAVAAASRESHPPAAVPSRHHGRVHIGPGGARTRGQPGPEHPAQTTCQFTEPRSENAKLVVRPDESGGAQQAA